MYTQQSRFYSLHDASLVLEQSEGVYTFRRMYDVPPEEKPREKLLHHGPAVLSVQELLSVVLNVGTKKEGILAMTSRIFAEYGERGVVHQTDPKVIQKTLEIPEGKACQVVACFELGRRFFEKAGTGTNAVRTADEVYEYLKEMRDLPKEQLRGLYVNSHYRIVHDEVISIGSINANIVHPREVFKPALDYGAVGVIIAHNHPSGVVEPSKADNEITEQLLEAGKILGIELLDHLIITSSGFRSLMKEL